MTMEYQSREYCKDIGCKTLLLEKEDRDMKCSVCDAYLFHKWLRENGYKITKEEK